MERQETGEKHIFQAAGLLELKTDDFPADNGLDVARSEQAGLWAAIDGNDRYHRCRMRS